MRVLVACEYSGVVREAFRHRGHSAWSCDILPADDGSRYHLSNGRTVGSIMLDTVLKLFVLLPAALGLFVLWHIFRPQQRPADESNRINKIRLVWFALTREELFVDKFPWLVNDEWENIK